MKNKKKGFSLLEIVVVMGVLGLLLPSVFGIVYIIMQQQLRIHRLSQTKQQGDLILNYMKESISRNAVGIGTSYGIPVCVTAGSNHSNQLGEFNLLVNNETVNPPVFLFVENNGTMEFREYTYSIVLNRYEVVTINLNDTSTVAISNFVIECQRRTSDLANVNFFPVVGFSYDATFVDSTPTAQEGVNSLHYQTKVKLRRTPN